MRTPDTRACRDFRAAALVQRHVAAFAADVVSAAFTISSTIGIAVAVLGVLAVGVGGIPLLPPRCASAPTTPRSLGG
ncbi:hypothetical protein WL22_23830 [Burkholderia ubonensis]|nr:hypothetical protein WL22_23830 [Burkholderia ubonensis]